MLIRTPRDTAITDVPNDANVATKCKTDIAENRDLSIF